MSEPVPQTSGELWRYLRAAKAATDEAMASFEQAIRDDAAADAEARKSKARAYLTAKSQLGGKATVPEINACVDLETGDTQQAARLAEGLKKAAQLKVESARQWMSSLQSLASLSKQEAQIAAYEPSSMRSA